MRVWSHKPCRALAPYVESFGFRMASLGSLEVYRPLPSRSDCFLEFYFADRYRIVTVASGAVHRAASAVLVGPHTLRREDLLLSGDLHSLTIRFTPAGFRALFGIPGHAIRNFAGEAESVLGRGVRDLHERLAGAGGDDAQVRLAEEFLLARLVGMEPGVSIVAGAAKLLARRHGAVEVQALSARYGITPRQMERLFQEQVGLSPKMFGRLARLKHAMEMGSLTANWADIAVEAGYFDQSHMVRDFRALTGETPAGFAALSRRATLLTTGNVAFVLSGAATTPLG